MIIYILLRNHNINQATIIKTKPICNFMIRIAYWFFIVWYFFHICYSLVSFLFILAPFVGFIIIVIIVIVCRRTKCLAFRKSKIGHSRLVNELTGAFEFSHFSPWMPKWKLPMSFLSYSIITFRLVHVHVLFKRNVAQHFKHNMNIFLIQKIVLCQI